MAAATRQGLEAKRTFAGTGPRPKRKRSRAFNPLPECASLSRSATSSAAPQIAPPAPGRYTRGQISHHRDNRQSPASADAYACGRHEIGWTCLLSFFSSQFPRTIQIMAIFGTPQKSRANSQLFQLYQREGRDSRLFNCTR
jgi:hypothetical protein